MLNAACTAPPANRLRSIGPVMTISFAANAISVPTGIAKCGARSVTLALFSQTDMNPNTTLADLEGGGDSQISFSVTHGWSAFGGADHGWQDAELGRGAWTLSDAVSGSVGPQGAATNVSSLRVGADRSWRSQEHSADGGPACGW